MDEAAEAADASSDTTATLNALEEQVDNLSATLESHRQLFELLRRAELPAQHNDGQPR